MLKMTYDLNSRMETQINAFRRPQTSCNDVFTRKFLQKILVSCDVCAIAASFCCNQQYPSDDFNKEIKFCDDRMISLYIDCIIKNNRIYNPTLRNDTF